MKYRKSSISCVVRLWVRAAGGDLEFLEIDVHRAEIERRVEPGAAAGRGLWPVRAERLSRLRTRLNSSGSLNGLVMYWSVPASKASVKSSLSERAESVRIGTRSSITPNGPARLVTAHAGKHQVEDDEVDRMSRILEMLKRRRAVAGAERPHSPPARS